MNHKVKELKELQEKIKYHFQDPQILRQAMIHSSYANENHLQKYECNERLEFLGDAVLELVSSEFLFHEDKIISQTDLTCAERQSLFTDHAGSCFSQLAFRHLLILMKQKFT